MKDSHDFLRSKNQPPSIKIHAQRNTHFVIHRWAVRTSPSLISVLQKSKEFYITHDVQPDYRIDTGEGALRF